MSFALFITGAVLLVASVKNTQDNLFALVQGDFTGQNNFMYWFVSILVIGAVGYIEKLKPLSIAFLTLLILVLVLTRGGLFDKFTAAIGSTQSATATPAVSSGMGAAPAAPNVSPLQIPGMQTIPTLPPIGAIV